LLLSFAFNSILMLFLIISIISNISKFSFRHVSYSPDLPDRINIFILTKTHVKRYKFLYHKQAKD